MTTTQEDGMHTAGPWIAWDDGRTVGGCLDGEPIAIAEIVDHGDMADPEQLLADQRLIAAAPELLPLAEIGLGALQREWLLIINNRPGLSDEGFRRLKREPVVAKLLRDIDAATAAIAKARGEDVPW